MDIKKLRKNAGFTQMGLSKKSHVSQSLICDIENGKRAPSVKIAKKIAKALDFDWTDFFKDDAQDKPQTDKKPA